MAPKPAERGIAYLPFRDIRSAERNAKGHDIGAIVESIRRFGFVDFPIQDGRTGRIVGGHGRVEALEAMHSSHPDLPPAGVRVADNGEWLVPVNVGWRSRSDHEAEALLIALNRTQELGGQDDAMLAAMLSELATAGELAGSGYDGDDVDALIAGVARDMVGDGEDGDGPALVTCPECRHRFAP